MKVSSIRVSSNQSTVWKKSKYGVFSGPYFPVLGLNTGKYGPEKLHIWTLFTQGCFERAEFLQNCNISLRNFSI